MTTTRKPQCHLGHWPFPPFFGVVQDPKAKRVKAVLPGRREQLNLHFFFPINLLALFSGGRQGAAASTTAWDAATYLTPGMSASGIFLTKRFQSLANHLFALDGGRRRTCLKRLRRYGTEFVFVRRSPLSSGKIEGWVLNHVDSFR